LEIADAIQCYSAAPAEDLQELWRRIVFTVLISNIDDHLCNHGWRLSPAYDLNPIPVQFWPRMLSTRIDEQSGDTSIKLALNVAEYFRLTPTPSAANGRRGAKGGFTMEMGNNGIGYSGGGDGDCRLGLQARGCSERMKIAASNSVSSEFINHRPGFGLLSTSMLPAANKSRFWNSRYDACIALQIEPGDLRGRGWRTTSNCFGILHRDSSFRGTDRDARLGV
jgi:hypothetical protein